MLNFIRTFGDREAIAAFVKAQLGLPPSMHEKFGVLRKTLTTRGKQFSDFTDLKSQLSYFHDIMTELNVFPSSWVIFASNTGYMFKKTSGRFVEGTESTFHDERQLGQFCSIRAKYSVLGLKDLLLMRCLKCSASTQKCIVELASVLELGGPPADSNDNGLESSFEQLTASLAAFDGDP